MSHRLTDDSSGPVCVATRVQFRHWWNVLPAFVLYRRLRAKPAPGLIRTTFAIESLRTFLTISIWVDREALLRFGGDVDHPIAVRWCLQRASEIWSAEWTLRRSSRRQRWDGSDTWAPGDGDGLVTGVTVDSAHG